MIAIDSTGSGLDQDSVNRMKAKGVSVYIGYVSAGGSWKHLDAAEVALLRKNAIDIVAVVEPGDADIVDDNGATLTRNALAAIKALGGPGDPLIWLGQDKDTSNPAPVLRVLEQAAAVHPRGRDGIGVYGPGTVCRAAEAAGFHSWQAQSPGWSGSGYHDARGWHLVPVPGVDMLQELGQPLGDLGMDYDKNTVYEPYIGQWFWKGATRMLGTDEQRIFVELARTTTLIRLAHKTEAAEEGLSHAIPVTLPASAMDHLTKAEKDELVGKAANVAAAFIRDHVADYK